MTKVYFTHGYGREVSSWFSTAEFTTSVDNSEVWSENSNEGLPHICRNSGWVGIIPATAYYSFSDEEVEGGELDWDYGLDYIILDLDALVENLKGEGFIEFCPDHYIKENEDLDLGEGGYIVTTNTGRKRYYTNIEDALLDEHGEDIIEEEEED